MGNLVTADGVELYYEDEGGVVKGADRRLPLFYVYGLGCSILHWKYPRAHFRAAGRRQLWVDFRGHGRSGAPLPGQRVSIDLIVDDIAALCRHLGVERAVFLGQSMGGSIVMDLAAKHPELAGAIVLLGSPGRDPGSFLPGQPVSGLVWHGLTKVNRVAPLAVRLMYDGLERVRALPAVAFTIRELIRNGGFNTRLARTEDIEEYIEHIFKLDPRIFYDLADDLSRWDAARVGGSVKCPALIIAGAQDKMVPAAETKYVADLIEGSELAVVPHGSHCPHFDDPRTVIELIEGFLRAHAV